MTTKFTTCQWYAGCIREAEYMCSHPALGEVPICTQCAAKHNLGDRLRRITVMERLA